MTTTMAELSDEQVREGNGYLTTTGRVSGKPHEIEIWFAMSDDRRTIYLLSGGGDRADWVKNMDHEPSVTFRILGETYSGTARRVTGSSDEQPARDGLAGKYYGWTGGPLPNDWSRNSLPMAITLN